MNRVFVDTSGFYAALNRRDAHHRDAARLFRRAQRDRWFLCTTNFVLAESHALILARMGRDRAWNFLQATINGSTNVIRAEEADERGYCTRTATRCSAPKCILNAAGWLVVGIPRSSARSLAVGNVDVQARVG